MKEFQSVVTRKGQVTIPAEIRHRLKLKVGDKVAFTVEDTEVRLSRTGSVVEATAGVLKTDIPSLTAEGLRRAAEESIAEAVVERSQD